MIYFLPPTSLVFLLVGGLAWLVLWAGGYLIMFIVVLIRVQSIVLMDQKTASSCA